MDLRKAAIAFGWFSLGIGLIEVVAPGTLRRLMGPRQPSPQPIIPEQRRRVSVPLNPEWLWARVGGDMLDLITLSSKGSGKNTKRIAITVGAVAGVTLLDIACAQQLRGRRD